MSENLKVHFDVWLIYLKFSCFNSLLRNNWIKKNILSTWSLNRFIYLVKKLKFSHKNCELHIKNCYFFIIEILKSRLSIFGVLENKSNCYGTIRFIRLKISASGKSISLQTNVWEKRIFDRWPDCDVIGQPDSVGTNSVSSYLPDWHCLVGCLSVRIF